MSFLQKIWEKEVPACLHAKPYDDPAKFTISINAGETRYRSKTGENWFLMHTSTPAPPALNNAFRQVVQDNKDIWTTGESVGFNVSVPRLTWD